MIDRLMTEQDGLDYVLGRLEPAAAEAFEAQLLDSPELQEDVFVGAMLVSSVRQYAAVVSVDSFGTATDA